MVSNARLSAKPRSEDGKGAARKLRAAGKVPAVVYGHGEKTRHLTLDGHELDRLFASLHHENTLVHLDIEGEGGEVRALVREVQRHPSRRNVLHVDLHQIHKGEMVHVSIPVRLVGTPPGVRAGGMLQHTTTDLEVRCVADSIPEQIDVDVSALEIGDSIHVRDLATQEGVEFLADGDRTICSVSPPTVSAETETEDAADAAGPEPDVIRRGREDEEEEAED